MAAMLAVAMTFGRGEPGAAQTALDERQQHVATIVTGEIEKLTGPRPKLASIR
jgi:hypothetical protein